MYATISALTAKTRERMIKMVKAVYKDGAVRCEKCGVEVWEGVDCDCGIAGEDHEGIIAAYGEKLKSELETFERSDFSVRGYELKETTAKASGNGAVAYVPKEWKGRRVAVIRLDK